MFNNLTHLHFLDFLEGCFECFRRFATFFTNCVLKLFIPNHCNRSVNQISKCNLFVNELTTFWNCSNNNVCIIFQYCWSVFTHAKLMMGVRQVILWSNRWRLTLVAWYCRIDLLWLLLNHQYLNVETLINHSVW